jgi:hypothetical protein
MVSLLMVVSKDKSNNGLFKNYIKMIKESEILSTQFVVYLNLEKKVGTAIIQQIFMLVRTLDY